jgi:hypothetical protein
MPDQFTPLFGAITFCVEYVPYSVSMQVRQEDLRLSKHILNNGLLQPLKYPFYTSFDLSGYR